jgi:acyl carrier protein
MTGRTTMGERLDRVVEAVLGLDPGSFSDTDSPETLETWDSIRHIQLIMAVEAEFGVELSAEEIGEMNSIGRIRTRVEEGSGPG